MNIKRTSSLTQVTNPELFQNVDIYTMPWMETKSVTSDYHSESEMCVLYMYKKLVNINWKT
jgi:hypothetical protein